MSTTANVTLTLTISANGSWGDDCNMAQIKKQAIESAIKQIRRQLQGNSVYEINTKSIKVTAITHDI